MTDNTPIPGSTILSTSDNATQDPRRQNLPYQINKSCSAANLILGRQWIFRRMVGSYGEGTHTSIVRGVGVGYALDLEHALYSGSRVRGRNRRWRGGGPTRENIRIG